MFSYPVRLAPDDNDTVLATFPDVPEAGTFGDDEDDALMHAVDALLTALAHRIDEGRASRLEQVTRALAALGKRLAIEVRDAA